MSPEPNIPFQYIHLPLDQLYTLLEEIHYFRSKFLDIMHSILSLVTILIFSCTLPTSGTPYFP